MRRRTAGLRPRGRPELLSIGRIWPGGGGAGGATLVDLPRTWVRARLGRLMEQAVAVMAADSEQGGAQPKGVKKQCGCCPILNPFVFLVQKRVYFEGLCLNPKYGDRFIGLGGHQ